MISMRLRLMSFYARMVMKRWLARVRDIADIRQGFETQARWSHQSPPGADYRNGVLGPDRRPVKWVSNGPIRHGETLLYIHGGGYVAGSPETHQHIVAQLCGDLGIEAVMPRYRLAPENPFPAGFDDVLACYQGLIDSGRDPSRIILAGDSAGGGLMFALLAHICAQDLPRPLCCIALSPLVDLTFSGASISENAATEAVLVAARVNEMAGMYLQGQDAKNPVASPLFADFPDCPPVLFHVCDQEILRDDTLAMQRHLLDQGADVLVRSWPHGFHVWHLLLGYVPEASAALQDIADFVKARR